MACGGRGSCAPARRRTGPHGPAARPQCHLAAAEHPLAARGALPGTAVLRPDRAGSHPGGSPGTWTHTAAAGLPVKAILALLTLIAGIECAALEARDAQGLDVTIERLSEIGRASCRKAARAQTGPDADG